MWRRVLLGILVFVAVSAFGGMIGLLTTGLGLDESMLDGTPFDSYAGPGILLGLGIGVPHAAASVAVWRRLPYAPLVAMVAAFGLAVWIFAQVSLIGGGLAVQWIYWALSMAEIGLVAAWLGLFRRFPAAGERKAAR